MSEPIKYRTHSEKYSLIIDALMSHTSNKRIALDRAIDQAVDKTHQEDGLDKAEFMAFIENPLWEWFHSRCAYFNFTPTDLQETDNG